MTEIDREQEIMDLLARLPKDKMQALKELFWMQLSYDRQDKPFPTREWSDNLFILCESLPILLASAGISDDFGVIYTQLAGELRLTDERQLISKMIQHYNFGLFVFSNKAQTHWHFVNVKYEKTDDHSKRRIFRRITISPDERLRTATERIALLDIALIVGEELPGLFPAFSIQTAHDQAFNVEKVTDDFFKHYTVIFRDFQNMLEKQTEDQVWAHDFALQFLNRLLFLYYIQRKRWLGDDPEFLRSLWRSYQDSDAERNTFVSQWLQVLFFEAFNNQYHGRTHFPGSINLALAQAPFLNGGLFERNELDGEYVVSISDNAFRKVFDFLESYNFTISEDTPLDQEVAVDPEMIGRVYESLVNISDDTSEQRDAGIFYTPRVEIDLMCRLSLVDWLKNKLGDELLNLMYQWVFAFTPEDKEAADQEIKKLDLWPKLNDLIAEVTVLDPACGSGSFLVGMLYILNDLQSRIDTCLGIDHTPYQRKKAIVGNSLYGVDIKSWAVNISELRLWLQLVVETQMIPAELKFKPLLPNLSFKIRAGDSLVQEIGGIDLNLNRARGQLAPQLGGRLTQLKAEKMKFFHNEPNRKFHSVEALKHEELRLFQDMLNEQIHKTSNKIKELNYQLEEKRDLFGNDTDPQLTTDRSRTEREVEELKLELERLTEAKEELSKTDVIPFVWDIAFVEMFEGRKKGFDIVVGNPPYLRQEEIHDPTMDRSIVTRAQKKEYKDKLEASVYTAWPKTFGYDPKDGSVDWKLSRKSDYYIYFFFLGLALLNDQGSFCFITSNSWLDVGYGKDLQKFLLTRGEIHYILDNQVQRSFGRADVNTVIVLLGRPTDSVKKTLVYPEHLVRFAMFKVPFDQVLSPVIWQELVEKDIGRYSMGEYRLMVKNQQTLYHSGLNKETKIYEVDKWGGKYLRAPDIYCTILEKAGDKFVRLGDITNVCFGIKTGANSFFFLDEMKIKRWEIEERFLYPAVKSPKEIHSIYFDPDTLKLKLFICHDEKNQLKDTQALEYIKYGESLNLHKRPSLSSRNKWWDLGEQKPSRINCHYMINEVMHFYLCSDKVMVSNNFQEIHIENNLEAITASCNCSITQLMINVMGRSNFGGGLMKIETYETANLLVPDPNLIPDEISSIIKIKSDFPVNSTERTELDLIVFNALGLNKTHMKMTQDALDNMIRNRLEKSKSI